jgi:tetratricopeptide (TPR) repeat protein
MSVKYTLSIIGLLAIGVSNGQKNHVIRGRVFMQNSHDSLVQGVQLMGDRSKNCLATEVTTGTDGAFRLVFQNRTDGQPVSVLVGKEDGRRRAIEVVNDLSIAQWRIPASEEELFEVFVCLKGRRDEEARLFYRIAKDGAAKELEQKKAEEKKLRAAAVQDRARITELMAEIALIRLRSDSAALYDEALYFASINTDRSTQREQRFVEALRTGRSIREARAELNLSAALQETRMDRAACARSIQEMRTRAKASEAIFDFKDALACYDSITVLMSEGGMDTGELIEHLNRVALLKDELGLSDRALDDFTHAVSLLRGMGDREGPYRIMTDVDLGKHHMEHQSVLIAEALLSEALTIADRLSVGAPGLYDPTRATALNNLGVIHRRSNRPDEARTEFAEALAIRRRLATREPLRYTEDVITTLINLGTAYQDQGKFKEGRAAYTEAIAIRPLTPASSDADKATMAIAHVDLAGLLRLDGNLVGALDHAERAMSIQREIATKNPLVQMAALGSTLNTVATIQLDRRKYKEADTALEEAMTIFQRCSERDPERHIEDMAEVLLNIGVSYQRQERYGDAEVAYRQALEDFKRLAVRNPSVFEDRLAAVQNNLGSVTLEQGESTKSTETLTRAKDLLTEALNTRKRLAGTAPQHFGPLIATSQLNLANANVALQRYAEAEQLFLEALHFYRASERNGERSHAQEMASAYKRLGVLYRETERFMEADSTLRRSVAVRSRLALEDPTSHLLESATTKVVLGNLLRDRDDLSGADKQYVAALNDLELADQLRIRSATGLERAGASLGRVMVGLLRWQHTGDVTHKNRSLAILLEAKAWFKDKGYPNDKESMLAQLEKVEEIINKY